MPPVGFTHNIKVTLGICCILLKEVSQEFVCIIAHLSFIVHLWVLVSNKMSFTGLKLRLTTTPLMTFHLNFERSIVVHVAFPSRVMITCHACSALFVT